MQKLERLLDQSAAKKEAELLEELEKKLNEEKKRIAEEKENFKKFLKEKRFPISQVIEDCDNIFRYANTIKYDECDKTIEEQQYFELNKCIQMLVNSVKRYVDFYKSCPTYIKDLIVNIKHPLKDPSIECKELCNSLGFEMHGYNSGRHVFVEYAYLIFEAAERAQSCTFDPQNPIGSFISQRQELQDMQRSMSYYRSQPTLYLPKPDDWKMPDIFERNNWVKYPWLQNNVAIMSNEHTDKKIPSKNLSKTDLVK